MSFDLRTALREAVADEPFERSDLHEVCDAGDRRVRRRAVVMVGSAALAAVLAAASLAVVSGRSDHEPRPAHVIRLDLSRAGQQDLDVVASVRTTWREPRDELDSDQFLGVTPDGRVLRSRYAYDGDQYELGLLSPASGRTDWLPAPPAGTETVVDLTTDRLVLFAHVGPRRGALLTFDRRSRAWQRAELRLPAGLEAHVPFRLAIGSDGRLHLGSNYEGDSTLNWWSYGIPQGGVGRPEPGLADAAVAWGNGMRVTADSAGRVVLSGSGADHVVADERPTRCEESADQPLGSMAVTVALAGTRPVVSYWCSGSEQAVTVVYDPASDRVVEVPGASVLAADRGYALLGGAAGAPNGTYLLDVEHDTLARIGAGPQEIQNDVSDGLALWNSPGPISDKHTYDVVWHVARTPRQD